MMWKIVLKNDNDVANSEEINKKSKASVLYIYIYIYIWLNLLQMNCFIQFFTPHKK